MKLYQELKMIGSGNQKMELFNNFQSINKKFRSEEKLPLSQQMRNMFRKY